MAGTRLGHEYQFNFDLPQARTAFQRTLGFLATTTEAEPMPDPAASRPPHPGHAARIAWRVGWVLLALVSMALTYGALVIIGR